MNPVLRRTGLIVGGLALIVAVGALAVRYWPGASTITVAAVALSPVILLAAVVIALIAFAAVRSWPALAASSIVLVVGVAVQVPAFVADDAPTDDPFTVMTANIQLGQGDVEQLADLVRSQNVDVLAVEELTPEAAARIARSTIVSDLPHSFVRPARLAYGTALYSRHPLTDAAELDGFALTTLTGTVAVPGHGDVQVFAVHPVPPTHADDWAEELERIGAVLQRVPQERPVVALGDFNATIDHLRFRRLLVGGYRDAASVAGAGLLPTYPTDKRYPPVVGIDHVVVRGLTASAVTSHDIAGADHRAVLAEVG